MSLKSKITDTLAQLLGGVKSTVDETRTSLADLKAQRQAIAIAMPPQAEAEAFVDRFVDEVAAKRPFEPSWLASPNAQTFGLMQTLLESDRQLGQAPLFFMLMGDTIRAALKAEVAKFYQGKTPGLSAAERAAKLDQLDAEIFEREVEEEKLISEAEDAGLQVDRRPDADPVAVLGLLRRKAA